MEIKIQKNNGETIVRIIGELDTVATTEQAEELQQVTAIANEALVIDCSELEYISSAGLRVLLTAQKTMNQQGSMKVTNVQEVVSEVFEVTGFADILTIE